MTDSQSDPRANQKQRTRAAIVEAAARLLRNGQSPSVAEAAEAAKVSRATAYRYFPTPEDLLLEVTAVGPAMVPVETLLTELKSDDPEQRLLALQQSFNEIVFAEEAQMRTALRAYLNTWLNNRRSGEDAPPLREGRRMRWLDTVLQPVRAGMSKQHWQRLQAALALTIGMEAMIVMKDVCHLDEKAANDTLRWAAQALLRAALNEATPTSQRPKSRR